MKKIKKFWEEWGFEKEELLNLLGAASIFGTIFLAYIFVGIVL